MKLEKIIETINPTLLCNYQDTEITGISYNSKTTQKGDIFICMLGEHTDGHEYTKMAQDQGAAAIVALKQIDTTLPLLLVEDTTLALGQIANIFYQKPSENLFLIGVTGTNGKTTVTHLIENIFEKAKKPCGLIGTLGQRISTQAVYTDAKHTTPQAPELQKTLDKMLENGLKNVVMEVSSHSLEQHRIEGCKFNGAVFTNLTQDHLDYHITMEKYANAKAKLFRTLNHKKQPSFAIINMDDKYAEIMKDAVPHKVKIYSYSIHNEKAKIRATNINYSTNGASFECITPLGRRTISLQMTGEFSIYNALAALATSIASEIDLDICIEALENTKNVAGRFEVVSKEPMVIVDYAHTPDGLENVLKAAKAILPNDKSELICVFGCGGDRDSTKRPKMAKIAENIANKVVITSDNPRSEDPQQIITDILSGIKSLDSNKIIVEIDRKEAINQAIKIAKNEDIVVIAGKGHEDYQILKDKTIHFDDREEARKALESKISSKISPLD